jgi:C4-type Zn-finger protein
MSTPEECDCCGFPTDDLTFYEADRIKKNRGIAARWLCELCACTMTGNAHGYPEQYPGQVAILKTVCYVCNVIRRDIARLSASDSRPPEPLKGDE